MLRRPLVRFPAVLAVFVLSMAPGAVVAQGPDAAAAVEQARVEEYWTAERMAGAIPRDPILVGGDMAGAQALADGDVTGASWTAGGAILQRSGRIFFTFDQDPLPGHIDYTCSGSVIQDGSDPAYSLIITAGHCAYDQDTGLFATNWIYVPAWDSAPVYDCQVVAYGCWFAQALVVRGEYIDEPGLTVEAAKHDYAIAVVGPGGRTGSQLDALGAYPIRTVAIGTGSRVHVFGYPAGSPYTGNDLVYCAGATGVAPDTGDWGLLCDLTGGASGGPWLYGSDNPADGSGEVISVSSYRPFVGSSIYGPQFDAKTQAVYVAAAGASPDAVGIDQVVVRTTVLAPFTDIAGSSFKADIEWLYDSGITKGCSATLFCPDASVTRGQMAAFLDRALSLPSTTKDYFSDDNGTTFEANINRLAASGITKGCTATTFCPTATVTRGQMAAFLDRAFALPATTTDFFTDDNGTTFEANINRLAASGITTGCSATTYCPTAEVTRGQMAAFLHRALVKYPQAAAAAAPELVPAPEATPVPEPTAAPTPMVEPTASADHQGAPALEPSPAP